MVLVLLAKLMAALLGGLTLIVYIMNRIIDWRIKQAGGVRAPVLAGNLWSGIYTYAGAGISQSKGSVAPWCSEVLDTFPTGPKNFAEFSIDGSKRVIITRDPEQIKTVLTTKFHDFGHGPQWHSLWRPFLGDGIFAVDGQAWHHGRSIIRPMFVKDRVSDLKIFENRTEKLLSKMPGDGATVDLKPWLYRFSMDSAMEFLLGTDVNSLDNPQNELSEALSVVQRKQALIFVMNHIAPLIPKSDYHAGIKKLEAYIEPIIARTIAIPEHEINDLSKSDEGFTLLHSIAQSTKDPKYIRDQILSVLLAGRDTTAATLSWAMYELAAKPAVWARLRREVLDVLGDSGRPDYETLKDLQYVRYTLNETLRLHPAVTINMRQALKTTTIPGEAGGPDVTVLKGDTITINARGMHLRRDLYPPVSEDFADPLTFSPERWQKWSPKPWTYIPFHGGPRICVGQNFALTEMAYCLVRFAQTFEKIEYRGDWHAQRLQEEIITTPALGVPVALFRSKS